MGGPVILFDVGNSVIKVALWHHDCDAMTVRRYSSHEFNRSVISSLLEHARGVVLSSVVPRISSKISETVDQRCIPCVKIDTKRCKEWGFLPGLYSGMGADRIAHCIGLVENGTLPAVCVDIGTAITVDRVATGPRYDGGFIIPGPSLMAEALSSGTALVNSSDITDVPFTLGRDTKSAVETGCWWGAVVCVEGLLSRLERNSYPWNRLVIAGGWAARISTPHESDPHHVFSGMRTVWEAYETGHYPG